MNTPTLLYSVLLCSVLLCNAGATRTSSDKEQTVVKNLDLNKYMGRWYQIAAFQAFFLPKDGKDTRATYTLNSNGTVHVLNEVFVNGKRRSIEGTAYKADPKSDEAKLLVKLYVLGLIPVVGDYWVLYIDDAYQNVVVGSSQRNYLFILSRKIHIDDATYNQLVQKAKDEGYDVSNLKKTPQDDPPPQTNA